MKTFHHIGLVAESPKAGEVYLESLKVWVTNPDDDPNRVEWVRPEADSPLAGTPVAQMPHVCWKVNNLDVALTDKTPVVGPLEAAPGLRIAYFFVDGALVEYLEAK